MAAKKSIESPWWYKQEPQKFMSSADVSLMSAEEVGSYFLLLQHAWLGGQDCSLPNEPERLARLARVPKVSDIVLSKFVLNKAGRLVNPRLSKEWADASQRSKAGKQASERRWKKSCEGNATRQDNTTLQNKSVSSQSASPISAVNSTPTSTPTPLQAASIPANSGERIAQKLEQVLGVKLSSEWAEGAEALLAQYPEEELTGALAHAARNEYWLNDGFMENITKVTKRIGTIVEQFREDNAPKKKTDSRKRERASAPNSLRANSLTPQGKLHDEKPSIV